MKLLRTFLVGLVLATLFGFVQGAFAYQSPGKPTGMVNDFANVFTVEQKSQLEAKLISFKNETSSEIAVVTIPTLADEPIEDYANELFREWGIGGKENNNGVLVLAAINDRKLRIEVGYGLEGALPDLLTKQIQETEIIPLFKTGNYAEGLNKGALALMQATQGEYEAKEQPRHGLPVELILFLIFFGFQFFVAILAPTKSWWFGGVLGAAAGGIIGYLLGALLFGIIGAVAGIGLGLLIDYFVSKNYKKGGGPGNGPWFFGGGSGGGFGGGFGGFGGGSSGGGGSSSSW